MKWVIEWWSSLWLPLWISPDLQLQFGSPSLQVEQVLLQVSFFCFECSDLSLQLIVLVLLTEIGILHVLFGLEYFGSQVFSDIFCLSGQGIVQWLLLRPKCFDFFLVKVKFFLECLDCLLEPVDLSLEGCSKRTSCHRVVCLAVAFERLIHSCPSKFQLFILFI